MSTFSSSTFRPSGELSRPRMWVALIIAGTALAISALIASTVLAASSASEAARLSRQDRELALANQALIKEVQLEDANLEQLLQQVKGAQQALANIGRNADARQLAEALCLVVGCKTQIPAPTATPAPQPAAAAPATPAPGPTPTPTPTPTPVPTPTIPSPLPLAPTAPAPSPPPLVTLPTLPLAFPWRFPGV